MTTKPKITAAFLLPLLVSFGCATAKPKYVKSEPLADPPPTRTIVPVPMALPLPGQLRPLPPSSEPASPTEDPATVVDRANRYATHNPDINGYFNALMQYDYTPGALYQLYTAPLRLTDIQLQPGEHILGRPAAGDTVRWVMALGKSSNGSGLEQQHIFVKPTRSGLQTTLVINTDRRTYHLELHSYKDTYMAAVQWQYPHDDLAQMAAQTADSNEKAEATSATLPNTNLENLNFGYSIKVVKGTPSWTPLQVFDDDKKTYIRFPAMMLNKEAPALFIRAQGNETQIVNYRVRNQWYIVDRLFDAAELRLGQQNQDIVAITNARN